MTGPARYEKGYSDALAHVAEGKSLVASDALVDFTRQAMVTGYVTLLHAQDAIQRNLGAGMTPGDAVIAALGDEPSDFLGTRRDLTESFVDVATLADDEALVQRLGDAMWGKSTAGPDAATAALRALAAALTERGEQHG